jgi:hypothetical protein
MSEGDYMYDYEFITKVETFEDKLSKYKNRMEFIRTVIGFIVLGIQIFILFHLTHQK